MLVHSIFTPCSYVGREKSEDHRMLPKLEGVNSSRFTTADDGNAPSGALPHVRTILPRIRCCFSQTAGPPPAHLILLIVIPNLTTFL